MNLKTLNLSKYFLNTSLCVGGILMLFSCGNQKTQQISTVAGTSADTVMEAPKPKGQFPFYKDIVIKPGLHFEVLSWGKGVDSIGGYLILMSDSVKNKFNSYAFERKGIITDVWNMDMDNDGNAEIYIELLSKKNVLDLNVLEYSGGDFRKINFPPLSSNAKKTYGGNDKFFVKNGSLFRSYPIVNSTDTAAKNGTQKILMYQLNGNSFSVADVKQE
jgi:hypothetical protein